MQLHLILISLRRYLTNFLQHPCFPPVILVPLLHLDFLQILPLQLLHVLVSIQRTSKCPLHEIRRPWTPRLITDGASHV